MNKINSFAIFLLVFLAGCNSSDVTFYRSNNDLDKNITKCSDIPSVKFQFKVDKENNKVMMSVYGIQNNTESLYGSNFLDDCQIINSNNFVCGGKSSWSGSVLETDWKWVISDNNIIFTPQKIENFTNGRVMDDKYHYCWFRKDFFGYKKLND